MKTMSSMGRPCPFGRPIPGAPGPERPSRDLAGNRVRVREGANGDRVRIALGSAGARRRRSGRTRLRTPSRLQLPTGAGNVDQRSAGTGAAPPGPVDPYDARVPDREAAERHAAGAAATGEAPERGGRKWRSRMFARTEREARAQDADRRSRTFRARERTDQEPRPRIIRLKARSVLNSAAMCRKTVIEMLRPDGCPGGARRLTLPVRNPDGGKGSGMGMS